MKCFVGVIVAGLACSAALADVTGSGLTITATSGSGRSASYTINGTWVGNDFIWESDQRVEFNDSLGVLGVLNPNSETSSFSYFADPAIALNFNVQAGASDTTFMIGSALLSFPTISSPHGVASAAFSVTDVTGDGALLTGANTGGGAYLAQYNGLASSNSGTTFTELISSVSAGAFATDSTNEQSPVAGFSNIGVPISDVSSFLSFSLSAHDLASGTTSFFVDAIPEPTGIVLGLIGLAGVAAARRRIA